MSRGTVGIVLCSLVLCSLVLADGASSESMGMEALGVGDRNLFTSTIGWTGHKLSHKQREDLHTALFENESEEKTEEDHWKDVSIMMDGAKELVKARPVPAIRG